MKLETFFEKVVLLENKEFQKFQKLYEKITPGRYRVQKCVQTKKRRHY